MIAHPKIFLSFDKLLFLICSAFIPSDSIHRVLIADEFRTLIQIQNPNILASGGFIVNSTGMRFVTEYTEGGNLLEFLKNFRNFQNFLIPSETMEDGFFMVEKGDPLVYSKTAKLAENLESLSTFDLISIAFQIALGMEHLARLSYIHYNLSLKNVYITENQTIRIGEMGFAKSSVNSGYNRNVFKALSPDSQALCAPEVSENFEFSEKSDVWCFGVCLYQIFTLGKELDPEEVLKKNLEQSEYCHTEIFAFILTCLSLNPSDRPTFSQCVSFLEHHMDRYTPQIRVQIDRKLAEARESQEELRRFLKIENEENED